MDTLELEMNVPRHPRWLIPTLAGVTVLCVVGLNLFYSVESKVSDVVAATHEIPPVFDDLRWLYGSVLALMLGSTVLGMGAVLDNVRFLLTTNGSYREPAKVAVLNEAILCFAFVLTIVGDVLVYMAWGEVGAPANSVLNRVDRILDGMAAVAFSVWLYRRQRARPVLIFQLLKEPFDMNLAPTWEQLRPKLLVGVGVLIVSFGVAFGK